MEIVQQSGDGEVSSFFCRKEKRTRIHTRIHNTSAWTRLTTQAFPRSLVLYPHTPEQTKNRQHLHSEEVVLEQQQSPSTLAKKKIRTLFLSWDIQKSSLIALRCSDARSRGWPHHRTNLVILRDKNSVLIICIIQVAVFFFFGQGSSHWVSKHLDDGKSPAWSVTCHWTVSSFIGACHKSSNGETVF